MSNNKGESMEKNIQVMVWKTDGADNACVYRLNDKEAGLRFFADLEANAEMDGRESFTLEMWDETQWLEACRLGDEMA